VSITEVFVNLNRTTLVLPLAGLLVVAGAGAVLATSGDAGSGSNTIVIPAAESASPDASSGTTTRPDKPKDTVLTDVLDDLVAKGTITESQKTAILDGLTAERTARREAAKAQRQQLRDFLADGQITQEELDQLPENSPLRQLTGVMDDGKITTDELRGLGRGFGFGKGHGHGFGKLFPKDGAAPDASPAPGESPASNS
jgi:polyhydroxyalkanoate synthesis regulator phasin